MDSIIQDEKKCYICGTEYGKIDEHHLLSGNSNRKWSEKFGLKIYLCRKCHSDVHDRHLYELELKQLGQKYFEEKCGTREEFISIFGKSFL